MSGLISFILSIVVFVVLIALWIEAPRSTKDKIITTTLTILSILFNNRSGNTGSSSSSADANPSIDYIPQRLGGSGWLNEGGAGGLQSAISCIEYAKRNRPNDHFRVAERRNGKIVGTVYSC